MKDRLLKCLIGVAIASCIMGILAWGIFLLDMLSDNNMQIESSLVFNVCWIVGINSIVLIAILEGEIGVGKKTLSSSKTPLRFWACMIFSALIFNWYFASEVIELI